MINILRTPTDNMQEQIGNGNRDMETLRESEINKSPVRE